MEAKEKQDDPAPTCAFKVRSQHISSYFITRAGIIQTEVPAMECRVVSHSLPVFREGKARQPIANLCFGDVEILSRERGSIIPHMPKKIYVYLNMYI